MRSIPTSLFLLIAWLMLAQDAVGALTSLANKTSANANISTYGSFVYDGVFNLTGLTASNIAQSNQNGATTWTHDTKDRLTQEASARLGSYTQNFAYDNAGNPTTWKGSSRSFNNDNQRSATGYTFDGNGNPTTYASTTMTYDVENRLTYEHNNSTSFGYRADGLRAYKENQSRTYFLYDGGLPVVELNASGTVTAYNSYGPDGLFARTSGGTTLQYVFDQQGNVAQRLNGSQVVQSSSIYDAYGIETTTGSPSDPFGYNAQWGYYLDRTTGLYSCMFRYYDPAQGRWLNRDPISYFGGINVYGYCAGNPVDNADPSGLALPAIILAGLAIWDAYDTISGIISDPSDPWNYVGIIDPTPGNTGSKILRGLNRANDAADAAGSIMRKANPDDMLYRGGVDPESASRLGRKAEECEEVLGYHGVSVSTSPPDRPSSSAPKTLVEEFFEVRDTPTRRDPGHKTVILPKPVTQDLADLFNDVFGRKRRGGRA